MRRGRDVNSANILKTSKRPTPQRKKHVIHLMQIECKCICRDEVKDIIGNKSEKLVETGEKMCEMAHLFLYCRESGDGSVKSLQAALSFPSNLFFISGEEREEGRRGVDRTKLFVYPSIYLHPLSTSPYFWRSDSG